MQITEALPIRRERLRRKARRTYATPPKAWIETESHRRAGGPEDRALYACSCGYAFHAEVTASVDCPHCGQSQPW
jgi:hypothetical protein